MAISDNTHPPAVSGAVVENLFESGKAHLKNHDYASAVKIFSRAVQEYPTEYRGWWGLILCATGGFTKETGQWATLNSWYTRVKRLAGAETLAALEREYAGYAQKIADADALKDIDTIGNIVKGAKANIRQFRERHLKALNEKAQLEKYLKTSEAEHNGKTERAAFDHARYEKRLKISGVLNKIAVLCFLSGLIMGLFNYIFIGIGFAVFIITVSIDLLSLSKMERGLDGAPGRGRGAEAVRNAVPGMKRLPGQCKQEREAEEKQVRGRIAALDREMKFLDGEIAAAEKRILPCEKYLALGKGRIASMFFVWRCASFGVRQEAENLGTVIKLRKAVWDERR